MASSYFDLDDILAAEETVPITTTTTMFALAREMPGLPTAASGGHGPQTRTSGRASAGPRISGGSGAVASNDDLPRGTEAAVPVWLARPMVRLGFAVLTVPQIFSHVAMRDFLASPFEPSMRPRSMYFYELGLAVSGLAGSDGVRIRKAVMKLFQRRYMDVVAAALAKGHDLADAEAKMSVREARLLRSIRTDTSQHARWLNNRRRLGAATVQ